MSHPEYEGVIFVNFCDRLTESKKWNLLILDVCRQLIYNGNISCIAYECTDTNDICAKEN